MSGWIKLHRKIQDHWIWESPEVNYFQAWTDMILNASHKPRKIMIKKQLVDIEIGQLAWSESFMQNRWKWSRNKVRNFLKNLKSDGMIAVNLNNKQVHLTSLISICNYSGFQNNETAKGATKGIGEGTGEGTQVKNVKKEKKKEGGKRFAPPTLEEIQLFVIEKGYTVNPLTFFSFYESKKWYVGKNKMKCWKSAITGWNTRDSNKPSKANSDTDTDWISGAISDPFDQHIFNKERVA